MGDKESIVKRLNEHLLFREMPALPMSFSIDDEYGAEAQEDGRIKITKLVDGEVKCVGWRNPDGTSAIASEEGDYYYFYNADGSFIGEGSEYPVCVDGEDYYFYSCDICFTEDNSDTTQLNQSAQRLAETPPENKPKSQEEPSEVPRRKLPESRHIKFEEPVPESHAPTQSSAAHSPQHITVTVAAPTQSTPHSVVSPLLPSSGIAAGAQVFAAAETSSAIETIVTVAERDSRVERRLPTASSGTETLCFIGVKEIFAPYGEIMDAAFDVREFVTAQSSPVFTTVPSGQMPPLPMGTTSTQPVVVMSHDGLVAPTSVASVQEGRCPHVSNENNEIPPRKVSIAAFLEGASIENEALGVFVGAPTSAALRSDAAGVQSAVVIAADNGRQTTPPVDNKNQASDQDNPNGNRDGDGDEGEKQRDGRQNQDAYEDDEEQ